MSKKNKDLLVEFIRNPFVVKYTNFVGGECLFLRMLWLADAYNYFVVRRLSDIPTAHSAAVFDRKAPS